MVKTSKKSIKIFSNQSLSSKDSNTGVSAIKRSAIDEILLCLATSFEALYTFFSLKVRMSRSSI